MKWGIKWWESFARSGSKGGATDYGGVIAFFYMIPGIFFVVDKDGFEKFSLQDRLALLAICSPWILLLVGGVAHCLWRGSFLKMSLPIFLVCAVLPVTVLPVVVALADRYDFTDYVLRNSPQVKTTTPVAPEQLKAEREP